MAALCALLASACGGTRATAPAGPSAPTHPILTAQWLRAQPGRDDGQFAFRLLTAAGQPQADWGALSVTRQTLASGATEFEVAGRQTVPDDLYLYIVYPGASNCADSATLPLERQTDYALLAIPRRIQDVLVVGVTRIAGRGTPAAAGPLLDISFVVGTDAPYRMVSSVNTDWAGTPLISLTAPGASGDPATLNWEELDPGDYNNNGEVEIADISPLGQLFKQTTATAPDPLRFALVDGDGNGEINLADLTPIGRNYLHGIDGYTVYRAVGSSPALSDYAPVASPTILRSDVFAATPEAQQKHRLQYAYNFAPLPGAYSYLVRAWSSDGSEGPESNSVSISGAAGNKPPQWATTVGITQLDGLTGGLRLHFGAALDPEGGAVSYVVRYILGPGPIGATGGTQLTLPAAATAGAPPYTYDLLGLASGTQYTLLLQAQDPQGLRTSNSLSLSATVPGLTVTPEPWGAARGNPARTGSNSSGVIREPLVAAWSQPLTDSAGAPGGPLISSAGWAAVQDGAGVKRFALADGASLASAVSFPLSAGVNAPALAGTRLLANSDTGARLLIVSSGGTLPLPSPDNLALAGGPLLLGDYLFGLDAAGKAYGQFLEGGGLAWAQPPPAASTSATAPCTDGVALYTVLSDGTLRKYAVADGADQGSGTLGAAPAGGALVYDGLAGQLYAATATQAIASAAATTLAAGWTLPLAPGDSAPCTPVVAHQFAPALVISAATTSAGSAHVVACDPGTGAPVWDVTLADAVPLSISAGNARVFVNVRTGSGTGAVLVLHPEDGSLLQMLDGPLPRSEAALSTDRLVIARQAAGALSLDGFKEDPTVPLTWTGATGIKALTPVDTDGAFVYWDPATAPDGLVVRYAVFYSNPPAPGASVPPAFNTPYPNTTVVSGLSAADGAAGYRLSLTPGSRYTVGVRAYYGRWSENAVTDGNSNYLAVTAAWFPQPPLDLGAVPPPGGTQLPTGETYLLQGTLDDSGLVHLVYNDKITTQLTHVFQDGSGGWQIESTNLGSYIAADFEPRWSGGQLHIGYADGTMGSSGVGVIDRTGPDTWSQTPFTSLTFANPQVSLALADPPPPTGQGILAFTEFSNGTFPYQQGQYYVARTLGGPWAAPVPLYPQDNCGRDLSAAISSFGGLWCALQRGEVYAQNWITPMQGELYFASDGPSGYQDTEIDAGDNAPASDVGKRVQLALDSAGEPHLAYLDLNASGATPEGELKYASLSGSIWTIQIVDSFDLSFQSFASLQYTWGELALAMTPPGSPGGADLPVIGMLARSSASKTVGVTHQAYPIVWAGKAGGGWRAEELDDLQDCYPNDREPCVLLVTPTAWHYFICTTRDVNDPGAKRIAYYKREL